VLTITETPFRLPGRKPFAEGVRTWTEFERLGLPTVLLPMAPFSESPRHLRQTLAAEPVCSCLTTASAVSLAASSWYSCLQEAAYSRLASRKSQIAGDQ